MEVCARSAELRRLGEACSSLYAVLKTRLPFRPGVEIEAGVPFL
jgi:hypothetical protein